MPSIIRATTTSGLQVAPDNSGSLQLQTNGTTTAVTIDTSQNVGIGTTSPTSILDIRTSNPTRGIITSIVNTATSSQTGAQIRLTQNGIEDWVIGQPAAANAFAIWSGRSAGADGTERMRIDSSGYASGTVNGLGRGIYQSQQYYRLNAALAGANVNTAQSIFGVGVTLVSSTQYEFEAVIALSKSAGATSHTVAIGFGGNATINNIAYSVIRYGNTTSFATETSAVGYFIQTASSTVLTGAIPSANVFQTLIIKGTISINSGGTFIPQYTLSAAPGGAYTTAIGSYIKIAPLAASGANVSIGSWA